MAHKVVNYNVTKTVGPNCANQPDDVLLVRFLLRRCNQAPAVKGPYTNLPLHTGFDNELGEAIRHFQKLLVSRGRPCGVDGKVSRAPKGDGFYTINLLYATYCNHFATYKGNIESDPECPRALAALEQWAGYL